MDISPIYKIVLRKVGSEKNLMVIENLNQAEAFKVFNNIKYPTLGSGFVKVLISNDNILRTKEV